MDENEMLSCSACSNEVSIEDAVHDTSISENVYCEDCWRMCERCEDIGSANENFFTVDGNQLWCESCAEYNASWCDYCEEYVSTGTCYVQDRDGGYCDDCIGNANYCENCDEYNMDGCDCEPDANIIHDYSYRPDPVFHGTTNDDRLFFGIEIEVENPARHGYGHKVEAAEYAQAHLEPIDLAYLKNDGSLSNGFEVVTHPMTHDFYMNEAPELWNTLEYLRTNMEMRSWSTQTCGLHIHISRTGFKGGAHMHRFLNLVYSNEDFYSMMAGRNSSRWAKFDDVEQSTWTDMDEWGNRNYKTWRSFREKIQYGRRSDRYSAVNTQNAHTLEMRIFKGSLKTSRIKAMISLAHASVEFTRNLTVQDVMAGALNSDTFMTYIDANASMYPDLVALLDALVTERQVATI